MPIINCDIGKLPKGHKRGTEKQCLELGKINYYGEKTVGEETIKNIKTQKFIEEKNIKIDKLQTKLIKARGERFKIQKEMDREISNKAKKEYEPDLKKAQEKIDKIVKKLKEVREKEIHITKGGGKKLLDALNNNSDISVPCYVNDNVATYLGNLIQKGGKLNLLYNDVSEKICSLNGLCIDGKNSSGVCNCNLNTIQSGGGNNDELINYINSLELEKDNTSSSSNSICDI